MTKKHCDILAFFYYEKQLNHDYFPISTITKECGFKNNAEAFKYIHDLRVEGYLDMCHKDWGDGKELAVYYLPDKAFKELKRILFLMGGE